MALLSTQISNSLTMTSHIMQQPSIGDSANIELDPHSVPQQQITPTQLTLLFAYLIVAVLWLFNYLTSLTSIDILRRKRSPNPDNLKSCLSDCSLAIESPENIIDKDGTSSVHHEQLSTNSDIVKLHTNSVSEELKERNCHTEDNEGAKTATRSSSGTVIPQSKRAPEPCVASLSKFMSSMAMFGLIMFYFYMCDYAKTDYESALVIFPQGERVYNRDTFLFLVFTFFLTGCAFTIKSNPDKILNREQTEEWKGWMQVMFVWYHYFMAKEWYNWIRVYIACYVWMTGFGNFSFFWIRNDFSMLRLLKMLFRLNFLVICVAITTNNEYMLYYICAMHTYWFLSVYVFMRMFNSWNRSPELMAVKFLAYAVINAVIFDIPGMTYIVFRPFSFILGFHDHSPDVLHEWSFRAGLDHWACFCGMLCAYNYPHFEAFMLYIDSKSVNIREDVKKIVLRGAIAVGCVLLSILWYSVFMLKDKITYNRTHPYSSIIPIVIFIVGRNIHPLLRSYHVQLFARLGKITLETYLSQLHIYLLANAHSLLVFLPGYPLLNFALATVTYLFVSQTLFTITNDCSSFLIPNDQKKLLMNIFYVFVMFGVSSLLAYGICAL